MRLRSGSSSIRAAGIGIKQPQPAWPDRQRRARVIYIDFEFTRSQSGLRYSQEEKDYRFLVNFFRAEYNFLPEPSPGVDANEVLIAGIEKK